MTGVLNPFTLNPFGLGAGDARPYPLVPFFAAGEAGLTYDHEWVTSFQDYTATIPAGTGDPSAFWLDLSRGAGWRDGRFTGLGPELVNDGAFILNGATVSDGEIQAAAPAFTTFARTDTYPPGYYLVTFSVERESGGNLTFRFNGKIIGAIPEISGTFRAVLYADDGASVGLFFRAEGSGWTGTISDISVRRLPGNHATQTVSAYRPTLGLDSAGRPRAVWDDDDFVTFPQAMPSGTTTMAFAYDPADVPNVTLGLSSPTSSTQYQMIAILGDGNTNLATGSAGTPEACWIDGAAIPLSGLSRDGFRNALKAGSSVIWQWDNPVGSTMTRLGANLNTYGPKSLFLTKGFMIDRALTPAERDQITDLYRLPS
ncbi:hypothetical protein [Amorphus sp. 3PC139-8]|uniref:hypothetical protein n=1 Tax=Amorphus sp. 3PC139-8 TaxID=2735676 RepID=UPI00345DACF9